MARKNGSTSGDVAALEQEIGKLLGDLETRVSRLNTLARQTASHAASDASEYVSDTLSDTVDRLRTSAEEAAERVRAEAAHYGNEALRKVEGEIEQRPLLTLAIAAGIGFLAGIAVRRG